MYEWSVRTAVRRKISARLYARSEPHIKFPFATAVYICHKMSTSSSQDAGGTGEYAAAAGAEPGQKVEPEAAESSTNDGKKPYEEERRILLDGVADSLARVVRKM